jgi:hypothetical protein
MWRRHQQVGHSWAVCLREGRPGPAERSTVAIDPSRSFLIVRLRSTEMHNNIINSVHDTIANLKYYIYNT